MKVKFKGKIYDDARKDAVGHIWFGGNQFEHVPERHTPYYHPAFTYFHKFTQTGADSWSRVSTRYYAKLEILEGE